ncbi:hypothetical protein J3F84DRAFT_382621 [Trichoderma pleuroticola]
MARNKTMQCLFLLLPSAFSLPPSSFSCPLQMTWIVTRASTRTYAHAPQPFEPLLPFVTETRRQHIVAIRRFARCAT